MTSKEKVAKILKDGNTPTAKRIFSRKVGRMHIVTGGYVDKNGKVRIADLGEYLNSPLEDQSTDEEKIELINHIQSRGLGEGSKNQFTEFLKDNPSIDEQIEWMASHR